jgi:hypothetical protein
MSSPRYMTPLCAVDSRRVTPIGQTQRSFMLVANALPKMVDTRCLWLPSSALVCHLTRIGHASPGPDATYRGLLANLQSSNPSLMARVGAGYLVVHLGMRPQARSVWSHGGFL